MCTIMEHLKKGYEVLELKTQSRMHSYPSLNLPVLGQTKGVFKFLSAKLAPKAPNLVLDLGQLFLCLISDFNHVELWINVT